jgi:prophage regulatory protein
MASNRAEPFPPNALLRLKDVSRLVGLSRSTIYKRVSDGTFPPPIRVSERSVRWRMQDLLEWTAGLAE